MAKMILKKKTKPAQKPVDLSSGEGEVDEDIGVGSLIDEIGDLELKVMKLMANPKIAKLASLRTKLKDRVEEILEGGEGRVFQGKVFQDTVGDRGMSRTITDLDKAKELMGNETFMKVAKIGLKEIDDYLNPEEREEVLEVKYTGARKHKFSKIE